MGRFLRRAPLGPCGQAHGGRRRLARRAHGRRHRGERCDGRPPRAGNLPWNGADRPLDSGRSSSPREYGRRFVEIPVSQQRTRAFAERFVYPLSCSIPRYKRVKTYSVKGSRGSCYKDDSPRSGARRIYWSQSRRPSKNNHPAGAPSAEEDARSPVRHQGQCHASTGRRLRCPTVNARLVRCRTSSPRSAVSPIRRMGPSVENGRRGAYPASSTRSSSRSNVTGRAQKQRDRVARSS